MCRFALLVALLVCWPVGAQASGRDLQVSTAIKPKQKPQLFPPFPADLSVQSNKNLFETIRDWHIDLADAFFPKPIITPVPLPAGYDGP
jgi:hypothetical protein